MSDFPLVRAPASAGWPLNGRGGGGGGGGAGGYAGTGGIAGTGGAAGANGTAGGPGAGGAGGVGGSASNGDGSPGTTTTAGGDGGSTGGSVGNHDNIATPQSGVTHSGIDGGDGATFDTGTPGAADYTLNSSDSGQSLQLLGGDGGVGGNAGSGGAGGTGGTGQAGNGTNGGRGGDGGAGGQANASGPATSGAFNLGAITLTAGNGGNGGNGAANGASPGGALDGNGGLGGRGGDGGAGGEVSFINDTAHLTVNGAVAVTGGNGGNRGTTVSSGGAGDGGNGGDAYFETRQQISTNDNFTVTGGAGGGVGNGAGHGGDADVVVRQMFSSASLKVQGGAASNGGLSGDGGDASFQSYGDHLRTGQIQILGGATTGSADASGAYMMAVGAVSGSRLDVTGQNGNAAGGDGGWAEFDGAGTGTLDLSASFHIKAGDGGNNGGNGGDALVYDLKNFTFTGSSEMVSGVDAGTGLGGVAELSVLDTITALNTAQINLTKNDGDLILSADRLLISADPAYTTNSSLFTLNKQGGTGDLTGSIDINTLELYSVVGSGNVATFTAANLYWTGANGGTDEFSFKNVLVSGTNNAITVDGFTAARGLQNMTFNVTGQEVGQGPMLLVDDGSGSGFDLVGLYDKFVINPVNALNSMHKGDKIIFIEDANGNTLVDSGAPGHSFSSTEASRFAANYGAVSYFFDLLMNGPDLEGAYTGAEGHFKPYFESRIAEIATLNNAGNALAKTVAQAAEPRYPDEWRIVTTFEGGHFRYDTGSHVDVDTLSLTLAVAHQIENSAGFTTFGIFFETGNGSYDTYNSFDFADIDGDGDTRFYGGGIFARHDFNMGLYLEASGRMGWVDHDYELDRDYYGVGDKDYDSGNMYYGAHVGAGYVFDLTENGRLDVYDKLFWTHIDSDDVSSGEADIDFDAINSLRNRLGARYTHTFTESVEGYAGAAWEYEFDGESTGDVYLFGAQAKNLDDDPDLKGSSGFAELGVTIQPTDAEFYIDLSAFGLIGTQEGVGGNLSLKYTF